MHRHISKGSWTFSDQDHGLQVSDCTAEGLRVINSMPPQSLVLVLVHSLYSSPNSPILHSAACFSQ
jgi:squalene cyclase